MFKKVIIIFMVLCLGIFITSCGKESLPNLVISKVFAPKTMSQNVIELYNNSNETIDLNGYNINIYTSGSNEPSEQESITLSGSIEPKEFFVITGLGSDLPVEADFVIDNYLFFSGVDALAISKGKTDIDVIGIVGTRNSFPENRALFRIGDFDDFEAQKNYNEFNFIAYIPNSLEYLKRSDYPIKTIEQLLDGPRLEERYLELPYELNSLGGGGAIPATLFSISDGDTARFFTEAWSGNESIRYYYINTPEVQGTMNAEPWGYVASYFNKQHILKDASTKNLHIQSIHGTALAETYGRRLALVWINGQLSQFLTVREGLSEQIQSRYSDSDLEMNYLGVPYLTFLRHAENNARQNGWGVFGYPINPDGEKSPDWNYQTNTSNHADNPGWTPHFAIEW